MADTYGVKVKLQYENNKTDLRNQLQKLLDDSVVNKPLTIKSFRVSSTGLRDALNKGFKDADVPLELSKISLNLSSDAINNLQKQFNDKELKLTIGEINATRAVNNLRSQLVEMLSGLQIGGVKEFLAGESITSSAKEVENYASNLQRLKVMLSSLNGIGKKLNTFGGTEDVQQALELYKQLSQQITAAIEANGKWENVDGMQAQLLALQGMVSAHEEAAKAAKKRAAEEEAAAKRTAAAEEESEQVVLASASRRATLSSQIQTWLDRNTKATDEAKIAMQGYVAELRSPSLTADRLTEIRGEFKQLATTMQETGHTGKSVFELFQAGLTKFGGWSIVTKTLTAATKAVKQMYEAVKELDSAMTELRRVTNLTEQGYKDFEKTAAAVAKKIGATVSDTINSTAD